MSSGISYASIGAVIFGGAVLFIGKLAVNGIFAIKKDVQSIKESSIRFETAMEYQGHEIRDIKKRLDNFEGVCSQQHGRPVRLLDIEV